MISDIPRKNARLYPSGIAVIDGEVRITFSEFNQRVNCLAHVILSLGLSKGDRVAVLNHNEYHFIELYFACAKAGTPIVPLNFRSNSKELTYIINDSGAKLIFFGSNYLHLVEEIKTQTPSVTGLISVDQKISGFLFYEDLIKTSNSAEPEVEVEEDDIAVLGYTGGTTGPPKGVMTTHRKCAISSCFNAAIEKRIKPGNVFLNVRLLFSRWLCYVHVFFCLHGSHQCYYECL